MLLCGLKRWFFYDYDHRAWALLYYVLLCTLFCPAALWWRARGNKREPAWLFIFFPVPFVLLMTAVGCYGSVEWLGDERGGSCRRMRRQTSGGWPTGRSTGSRRFSVFGHRPVSFGFGDRSFSSWCRSVSSCRPICSSTKAGTSSRASASAADHLRAALLPLRGWPGRHRLEAVAGDPGRTGIDRAGGGRFPRCPGSFWQEPDVSSGRRPGRHRGYSGRCRLLVGPLPAAAGARGQGSGATDRRSGMNDQRRTHRNPTRLNPEP